MEKINVWMRVGISVSLSKEELDDLFNNNNNDVIKQKIEQGEFELNGDSYIPSDVIAHINDELSTNYEEWDFEFEF